MLIVAAIAALLWTAMAIAVIGNCLRIRLLQVDETPTLYSLPTVEVVIPALNEELRVAETIDRVLAQDYPSLRVTVVNDRSTDRTGAILDELAKTKPLRVIHGAPRPHGWVGKTWAVKQGADGATSEWLFFVDADMGLHPRALITAIKLAQKEGA